MIENTTISVSKNTKKTFLDKKRRYCVKNNQDINADKYLKHLLERD